MDLLYDAADALYRFIEASPGFPVSMLYIAPAAIPVVLVHEFGHARAARRLLDTEVGIESGPSARSHELRLGQIETTINAIGLPGQVGGAATFDDSRATARHVFWLAIARPLASVAGTIIAGALYSAAPASGVVHDFLWCTVAGGVFGVLNIIPLKFQERRTGPVLHTDGRLALDALRVARALP
jgi:Zn-dependent protease